MKKKYSCYVVSHGRIPGIYETWNECRAQTDGFPGARFRGYRIYEDAIAAWDAIEQGGEGVSSQVAMFGDPSSDHGLDPILSGMNCPYCGGRSILADSAEVYNGRSYGMIWLCRPCKAWVGCHKGSHDALGRLADAALRKKKQEFHAAFDPIWKGRHIGRGALYAWLAGKMGISKDLCHGGMFDIGQCDRAVEILKGFGESEKTGPIISERARRLVSTHRSRNLTACTAASCTYPKCLCGT